MTHMVRWDPFGEFTTLRRAMDRVFEDFGPDRSRGTDGTDLTFPIDLSETEDKVAVKAVLPGVKPEDVDISVSENVLTIKGQSRFDETTEKENFYRREIRYGSFSRSIPLPTRVDYEKAPAAKAGVQVGDFVSSVVPDCCDFVVPRGNTAEVAQIWHRQTKIFRKVQRERRVR